jgi:hypothetical protein
MGQDIANGKDWRLTLRSLFKRALTTSAIIAPLALLAVPTFAADSAPPATAPAATDATSSAAAPSDAARAAAIKAADEECFDCHASASKKKTLGDGAILSLQVPKAPYLQSVHAVKGCVACHSDVDVDKHPPKNHEISDKRSFAIEATQVCRKCHPKKFKQWEQSIHGQLVKVGAKSAPICVDCHNPHAVIEGAASQVEQAPCKACHGDIFKAYLGSMHAKSRLGSADSEAPVCAGCHTAHSVKPISAGANGLGPETACLSCHKNAPDKHANWLPNVALHFETVACPACHSPNAERKVDLILVDGAGVAHGVEKIGVPLFEASNKSDSNGIDAQRLWTLMQGLDRSGIAPKIALRGHLDVANGVQAHQMADKSKALSDCHTCHQEGSQAFQKVTVSLVGPQGLRVGYGANADVLNSAFSVDSIRGFYAIGGTRIVILDILLALAVISGLGIAFGHIFVGWMFKRFGFYHPHHERKQPPTDGDTPQTAA